MLDLKQKISGTMGVFVGGVSSFFIGLDTTLKILLVFMMLDFILGFMNAYIHYEITSNEMYKGAIRKAIVFVIIYVAYKLATVSNVEMIQDMTVIYYLSMETLSIFEHAVDFEVPLPKFLKDFAERLNEENNDTIV